MVLKADYKKFITDIEILKGADKERNNLGKELVKGMESNNIVKVFLKHLDYKRKDLIAFQKEACEKVKDLDWSFEPINNITKGVNEDFNFNESNSNEKYKEDLFKSKDVFQILSNLDKWIPDNTGDAIDLEYLSFGNSSIDS
jgi:hypothetical protein